MDRTLEIDSFDCGQAPVCLFRVTDTLLFDLDAELVATPPGGEREQRHLGAAGIDVSWLPEGGYRLECPVDAGWPAGTSLELIFYDRGPDGMREQARVSGRIAEAPGFSAGWRLGSAAGSVPVEDLSWSRRGENWLFRHFDHAARTIIHLMFDDHPKLRGDVLDVGCGDGITDLSLALRKRPRRLVGVDPFRGYERLPQICRDHHLPESVLQCPGLEFRPDDGNELGFANNEFDVVLSWGSLEHIAGGYHQTLTEIRRVLRPGGLFFAHPGLYFGSTGNHLGEFFDDPWIHLKLDRDELRQRVLSGRPRYMDRAGEESSPAQYWQWFTELNAITVPGFELEMRELGFEPWRFALRTDPVVEYSPELVGYDMTTLGISELYAVFVNRKPGE